MRYSPVSPPQDLILPYQQKDRQQFFLNRLLPIVFDDKALSGVFILVILPAYLQLAPLRIGNAADYQWSIGIMGLSPLRGTLRAAPSKKRRKYHYTRHLHRRKQPHHTTVIALRRSLTPFREVLASEAVLLRRSGKIRSTELFGFQGAVKKFKSPLHFTTDKKSQNGGAIRNYF